jgi:hypothetical protein
MVPFTAPTYGEYALMVMALGSVVVAIAAVGACAHLGRLARYFRPQAEAVLTVFEEDDCEEHCCEPE